MRISAYIFIIVCLFVHSGRAASNVVDRKAGFLAYKKEVRGEDQKRESDKSRWFKSRVSYEEERAKELAEYLKKRRKTTSVSDDFGPEIRDWRKGRAREFDQYEDIRKGYVKTIPARSASNLSEMEELDLIEKGERAEFRTRVLYGGKPNYARAGRAGNVHNSGAGSGSSGAPAYVPRPSDNNSYTAPPTSGDGDYQSGDDFLPPPPPPEGFEPNDIPPPPPFIPEDMNDGFVPPPPPPPFEDDAPPPVY